MDSEETLLQNLRTQVQNAQSGNLGTNQLLQLGLTIASEQLDEIRSLERMMAIQFQAQQAYMYAHSNDQTRAILGQASVEAFFAPMASPSP
jgi:regulator of PEP synthase PpsR (kinase-PPPase family)